MHRVATGTELDAGSQPAAGLTGIGLRLARAGWVVVALCSVTFYVLSLEDFLSGSRLFWLVGDTVPSQVVRDGLDQHGISPELYAAIGISIMVVWASASYLVGLLLFWRKSHEPIALLVAYLLVGFPGGATDPRVLHDMWGDEPLRAAIGIGVDLVVFIVLIVVFLIFPDGRFTPRWTRWLTVAWIAVGVSTLLFPVSPLDLFSLPSAVSLGFFPLCVGLAIFVQVWRYRHTSSPLQRQQTKWFALGFAIVLADFAILGLVTEYARTNWPTADPSQVILADLTLHLVHSLAFLAIPLTLAIAILRYRLWDIGILINRALVYGSLSVSLLAVYLALVVLLQELLQSMTGSGSDLAIAASTLVTAALFRPLRGRLQGAIDRRFYRRRYDAARTVSTFGSTLREEMDLERIEDSLLAAVRETVQPAHASLWLRAAGRPERTR